VLTLSCRVLSATSATFWLAVALNFSNLLSITLLCASGFAVCNKIFNQIAYLIISIYYWACCLRWQIHL